jgi:hypothetical protein
MKRVLLVALAAIGASAALASSALAASPVACRLVTVAEYKQVLGKSPSKLTPSEGTSTCFVTGGGVQVGVQLGSFNAAQVKAWKAMPNAQRIPSLGPNAFSLYRANYGISVYATKGTWLVAISGKTLTKAQAIKLTAIALKRV